MKPCSPKLKLFCSYAWRILKNKLWMLVAVKKKPSCVWSCCGAACLLIARPYISFLTNIKDTALLEDIEMHNNRPRGALNPKASCTAWMQNINVPYVALIWAAHCTKAQSILFPFLFFFCMQLMLSNTITTSGLKPRGWISLANYLPKSVY